MPLNVLVHASCWLKPRLPLCPLIAIVVLCDRFKIVDIGALALLSSPDGFSAVCPGRCAAGLLEHGIKMPEVLVPTSCRCLLHSCALLKQLTGSPCFGLTQGGLKREAPAFSKRPGDAVGVTVEMCPYIGKRCLVTMLLDVVLDGGEVESAVVAPSYACHMRPPIPRLHVTHSLRCTLGTQSTTVHRCEIDRTRVQCARCLTRRGAGAWSF